MSAGRPGIEKSRSIEDLQHMRLMVLLGEQVRDKGIMRAARDLNVDHRTLAAGLETGRLSRRLRGALEKALLEGGGSPAAEQRARNDALAGRVERLEGQVEEMGAEMSRGLAAVQDEVRALRDEQDRAGRRLARLEGGEDGREEAEEEDEEEAEEEVRTGTARPPGRSTRLRREFPDLVTVDPAEDDEDVFGEAWPLVREWREIKESHPSRGKGLEWLRGEERRLAVELALLEEHGLTLPPETYPLKGLDRGGQVNWRWTALDDTRRVLKREELLLRLRRLLTVGLWRG